MFVRNGQTLGSVQIEPKATPKPEKAEPALELVEQPEADEPQEAAPEAPGQHDLKADWVDFAVGQGAERSEAEGLTKAELIELYGG